jgi:hypothetical protein
MKCPACWAEKAYRRKEDGAWGLVLRWLAFVPMRCRHCYHKFWVHRVQTIGKVIEAPAKPQAAAPLEKPSVAAQFLSQKADQNAGKSTPPRRAA